MGEHIELADGETLQPDEATALQLHAGVVAEVQVDGGRKVVVDVHEGPAWLPMVRGTLTASEGILAGRLFSPTRPSRFSALGPARVERHKLERVDPLAVLGERVIALRRRLLTQLEPFQDFLDPRDGRIPRADYAAPDVDVLVLPVPAPADLVEGARAEGLTPLGDVALETWTAWRSFGALGRTTSYDEVGWFLPTRERVLFCQRIHPDSAAAVLLGRELFGFPKSLAVTRLGRDAAWCLQGGELTGFRRWQTGERVDLDVFGAELTRTVLGLDGVLDDALGLLARALDHVPLSTLADWLEPPIALGMAFPGGGRARMTMRAPRDVRRVDADGVRGWRLRAGFEVLGQPGDQAAPRVVLRAPGLVTPSEPVDGTFASWLGPDARVGRLNDGQAVEVPPDSVALVRGAVLRQVLVQDGVRYIGHVDGHQDALFGVGTDAWLRMEAHGEARVAVAPESVLAEVEPERLRGPLRATEVLLAEDLARFEAARHHDDAERLFVLQPVELDRRAPLELGRGDGPALVMLRVPFTLRHQIIVEARALLPHELDLPPRVGLGGVDLAAIWLPTGTPGEYAVAASWALDVETLLASRRQGWPSRLAQLGPGGVTVVCDGEPVIEQAPPAPVDGLVDRPDVATPPAPPPETAVPEFEVVTLVMPSGRRVALRREPATLGRAPDEHGFRTGPPLPVAVVKPVRVDGREALDPGVNALLRPA